MNCHITSYTTNGNTISFDFSSMKYCIEELERKHIQDQTRLDDAIGKINQVYSMMREILGKKDNKETKTNTDKP